MKITVVTSPQSWIDKFLPDFFEDCRRLGHSVEHFCDIKDVPCSDVAYYLTCQQIVTPDILARNRHNLVSHSSDLPKGKGWSPLNWQVIEGKNRIPTCLFEVTEKIDAGKIYIREELILDGYELLDEIRAKTAEMELNMCYRFLEEYPYIVNHAKEQVGESTYYPKRTPKDSMLDIDKSIKEQFNLLRVVSNEEYPAFFEYKGHCYTLKIEKHSMPLGGEQ